MAEKFPGYVDLDGIDDARPEAPPPTQAPDEGRSSETYDARPPAFSDDAIALRFAELHAGNLRYVAKWNQWFSYDGSSWQTDDTLAAYDQVRIVCRQIARECARASNKDKIATAIASGKTVAAIERLARADRRIAATTDQWDADPWLLNTPEGVVDLKTGQLRAHRPEDYMTKITATGPRGDCPRFLAFLNEITAGDAELIAYLRRALGYSLTGDTREHALFFSYGTGANGKSVLLSTVAGILGAYHRSAAIETFTATNGDRHPTDLAGLRGARLVTATETEEGRRWAESRIKQLTGGDPVAARFMRQDFFEYRPAFKLMIAGNHKPSLRSFDEAIRRRFHMIHFAVTIPPEDRDGELTEKLKAEWPGILQWLVDGCLDWQAEGLRRPQAVVDATEAYLEGEDALGAWMDEKCERDPNAWASSSALFASWSTWATQAGEFVGSSRRFTQSLESRGIERQRTNSLKGFRGLRLTPDEAWSDR